MTTNGQPRIDYTSRDFTSLREAMLEYASERLPEWTDHSPNDLGVLLVELVAYLGDALAYHQDRIASESYLTTAAERRSILNLLRLIGYELRPPVAASADLTLRFEDVKPEDATPVHITPGTSFSAPGPTRDSPPIRFTYVRRDELVLDLLNLSRETADGQNYFRVYRTLPVVQTDEFFDRETLGSSDGQPNQRFTLSGKTVLPDTLLVEVDEGGGARSEWQRQETLLYSTRDDRHYVLRYDENNVAHIEFGDGTNGRVPRRGQDNVTATYYTGGGARGNVPRLAIATTDSRIDKLAQVLNEQQASGGSDQEAVPVAVQRAPLQFRSMGRAVTASDYVAHALAFGVAKARAVATTWNRIQLVAAPAGGGPTTDTFKQDLRAYFESRRIVSSILDVVDPRYVGVIIRGTLDVDPYFLRDQVELRVREAVRTLWSFDNVDFGDTLFLSKLFEAVEAVEGVAGVNIEVFARADDKVLATLAQDARYIPSDGRLAFRPLEIPISNGFDTLTVRGGRK